MMIFDDPNLDWLCACSGMCDNWVKYGIVLLICTQVKHKIHKKQKSMLLMWPRWPPCLYMDTIYYSSWYTDQQIWQLTKKTEEISTGSATIKNRSPPLASRGREMSRLMNKPTKWLSAQRRQISLGISPVWSESSLCTQWVDEDPSFLHADSEDSDQSGRMPRLIWDFAVRTVISLVLSWGGSNVKPQNVDTQTGPSAKRPHIDFFSWLMIW